MDIKDGVDCILSGDALAFLGAGFSRGATSIAGTPLKTASQLVDYLVTATGLAMNTPLEDASEEFARARGDDALIRLIKEEFTVTAVTPFHQSLASHPWKRVFTANYDDVNRPGIAGDSIP